jgi:hypothetical protein
VIAWLVVVWLAASASPDGLSDAAVLGGLLMYGFVGAALAVMAPPRWKLYVGALSGILTTISHVLASFVGQLATGEFGTNLERDGEALAELPFWVIGLSLIGGVIGLVGGAVGMALTRSLPPRTAFANVVLLGVALVAALLLLLALPGVLYR